LEQSDSDHINNQRHYSDPEGVGIATWGLFGGHAGGSAHGWVKDLEETVVHDCGTGELVTLTTTDRIVEVQLSGGAGYGDPSERAPGWLDDDVADGYVSEVAARTAYAGSAAKADAAE
jgi:5-oxoprolinase (ATP-hydrolysing)/N-methylhydantoinase A